MTSLLSNLIQNYINENENSDLISTLNLITSLEDNPSNILNIEINEEIINLLFEENKKEVISNLKFIKRIFLAEQSGIHFDLTKEQEELMTNFIASAQTQQKKCNNSLQIYKDLIKKIEEKKEFITELKEITFIFEKMNTSVEEKNKTLMEVLNYNKKIASKKQIVDIKEELIEEVKETKLTEEALKELFEKYDINLKIEKDIIIENSSYEKVESLLELLKEKELSFILEQPNLLINILAYSNSEVLKNLLEISHIKNFKLKDLKNISSIFIPKSKKRTIKNDKTNVIRGYENFTDILEALEKNNYDIQLMINNFSNIFRLSSKLIRKNIKAFNLYRLQLTESRKTKGISSYAWMSSLNLMDVYDSFIELGLGRYVKMYTSKLTLPKEDLAFYRIYYAQKNNLPYYKVTDRTDDMFYLIGEVWGITPAYGITSMEDARKLCGSVSLEKNEEIENILNNDDNIKIEDLVFKNEVLKQLETYKKDMMTYDFNGKLISRFKVLRLANTLLKNGIELNSENLLYLISKNSILSKDQLEVIESLINNLDYGKEK